MVSMLKIDFGINARFSGSVEEVGDERKWISVFDSNLVESSEVDAKSKTAVFLLDEKDWSSVRRSCRTNESDSKMFIYKLSECFQLDLRE